MAVIDTAQTALYVATNLETWEAKPPIRADQDRECEACGFRRLDPEYYAWLRARMVVVRKRFQLGRVPTRQYEELRARFNPIHAWALRRFGEQTLLAAVKTLVPARYHPPAVKDEGEPPPVPPHTYPPDGDWQVTEPVSTEAVAKVDSIRERAIALGWSEAQLYQNRGHHSFPYGQDYGLVCFVGEDERLGEITRQSIEIIGPRGSRLRFYNHEVEQPWLHPASQSEDSRDDLDTFGRVPVGS